MRCRNVAPVWQDPTAPLGAEPGLRTAGDRRTQSCARVRLELDGLTAEALEDQAGSSAVSVEDLVGFSVLYYLADVESGRIARTVSGRVTRHQN